LRGILGLLQSSPQDKVMRIVAEVIATSGDLRVKVNPKYRFDERELDLCLFRVRELFLCERALLSA
ncbi:hypothetical protein, partial [Streptomyces brasiliscabiei]|uniref:hypothetical protein n=1 Tax=Streptomyces brasiliscabiei TaxID=2736302 RepID=UPI001C11D3B7